MARSQRQLRSWHAVVVTVALLAGTWWLTSANAVAGWSGSPNASSSQLGVGESMYVGQAGLADRPVVATSLRPVATSGLRASLFLCEPTGSRSEMVGIVPSTTIDDYCTLVPVTGTILLRTQSPGDYLIIEVTRTKPGPQRLCGVDIRYRDGWRWGQTRAAAYDVVFGAGDNALDDPSSWPSCPGR